MLKIGLTGGIGSGKSLVAKIFSTLDIPVYDADSAAKRLMQTDETLIRQITDAFGKESYQQGRLNGAWLASVVFNNEKKLQQLNAITHPATVQDSIHWFSRQKAAYAIKEAALLFESGSDQLLDYIIGVWAPEELRIQRVLSRAGMTREKIMARIDKQMDEDEKMSRCHFIIDNSGSRSVIQQVMALHQKWTGNNT